MFDNVVQLLAALITVGTLSYIAPTSFRRWVDRVLRRHRQDGGGGG